MVAVQWPLITRENRSWWWRRLCQFTLWLEWMNKKSCCTVTYWREENAILCRYAD